MALAHLTFDLGLGYERGDRVDDHDVHGAGADQDLDDLERLLAGVGLGDQKILDVHAQLLGVLDVEGVLRIDVGGDATHLLDVGREMEGERGLARGLRAVDLGDAAAGNTADPGGRVEIDGPGGDGGHLDPGESAPIRMMAPLPSCFSIWEMASPSALRRSASRRVTSGAAAMVSSDKKVTDFATRLRCEPNLIPKFCRSNSKLVTQNRPHQPQRPSAARHQVHAQWPVWRPGRR